MDTRSLVYGYLLIVPLGASALSGASGHDFARIAQIGLFPAVAASLAVQRAERCFWPDGPGTRLVIIAILVLAAGSVLAAPSSGMAAREAAIALGLASIALALGQLAPRTRHQFERAATAAAVTYLCVVLGLIAALHVTGQRINRAELFVGYDNYRIFNHVQTVAVATTALTAALATGGRSLQLAARFGTVAGLAVLLATGARASLLGLAVGAAACGILFRRGAVTLARELGIGLVGGALVYLLLFVALPPLTGAMPDDGSAYHGPRESSIAARLYLWTIAWQHVTSSPWLGIGPMHYAHHLTLKGAHPHNLYLQVAAEWGIPMLVLLLYGAGRALHGMARSIRGEANDRDRTEGVGLFAGWVAVATDAAFSGNLVMPVSQVWIAFLAGWTVLWWRRASPPVPIAARTRRSSVSWRLVGLFLLAFQLWLSWHVWPEVRDLDAHLQSVAERFPSPRLSPRFWSNGWF